MHDHRPPIDTNKVRIDERQQLLNLLGSLEPEQWNLPTECPAWTVKGVVTHLIGDDLSLLSRQRDEAPSGLIRVAADHPELGFLQLLDTFNETWVSSSSFFSTRLLVDLLAVTGQWTAEFYRVQDPMSLGEPVFWLGPQPAPYWRIAQREYGERWLHHLQIARAVGEPGPVEPRLVIGAAEGIMGVILRFMDEIPARDGTTLLVAIDDTAGRWSFERQHDEWMLLEKLSGNPSVQARVGLADAPDAFSLHLSPDEVKRVWNISGDSDFSGAVRELFVRRLGSRTAG